MFISVWAKKYWPTIIWGLVLTQLPLLQVIGYEASAISGIYFQILVLWKEKNKNDNAHPVQSFSASFQQYVKHFVLLTLVLFFNSWLVPNCEPLRGFYFWIAIPPVSIIITVSVLQLTKQLFGQKGWWFGLLILFGNWGCFAYALAFEPPIIGYGWAFGWFAGSIYDEALHFPAAVFFYRLLVLGWSILFVLASVLYWKKKNFQPIRRVAVLLSLGTLLQATLFVQRYKVDIDHSQETVQSELGGQLETEHFIVYFAPSSIRIDQQKWLKEDLEFRYWELEQFFAEDPVEWRGRKIEVFIYPNRSTQYRLMGSRRTLVARPWTHQMHIRWQFGASVVAHEMAHLFTASFGHWPTQLAMQSGIWPNLGLIEGIAVAADWGAEQVDAHQISSVFQRSPSAIQLEQILSPQNFWQQPAGKAYQMVGSFVRWLVEEYGIEKLKELYGGKDYQEVYGESLSILVRKWRMFLTTVSITDDEERLIRFRYERPTIFMKMCARAIAEEERNVEIQQLVGNYQKAKEHVKKMIDWEKGNWRHHYRLSQILRKEGKWKEAKEVILNQLKRNLSSMERRYLKEELADIYWLENNVDAADLIYQELQEEYVQDSQKRTIFVKRYFITQNTKIQTLAKEYFFADISQTHRIWLVSALAKNDVVGQYLLDINWANHQEYQAMSGLIDDVPQDLQEKSWQLNLQRVWFLEDKDEIEKQLSQVVSSPRNQKIQKEYQQRWQYKNFRD